MTSGELPLTKSLYLQLSEGAETEQYAIWRGKLEAFLGQTNSPKYEQNVTRPEVFLILSNSGEGYSTCMMVKSLEFGITHENTSRSAWKNGLKISNLGRWVVVVATQVPLRTPMSCITVLELSPRPCMYITWAAPRDCSGTWILATCVGCLD